MRGSRTQAPPHPAVPSKAKAVQNQGRSDPGSDCEITPQRAWLLRRRRIGVTVWYLSQLNSKSVICASYFKEIFSPSMKRDFVTPKFCLCDPVQIYVASTFCQRTKMQNARLLRCSFPALGCGASIGVSSEAVIAWAVRSVTLLLSEGCLPLSKRINPCVLGALSAGDGSMSCSQGHKDSGRSYVSKAWRCCGTH